MLVLEVRGFDVVKSYSFDETELLSWILALHCKGSIDLDPTYSKGHFYKNKVISEPLFKFDLDPQVPGCQKADCRHLPFGDSTINTIIYDPPFLATTGKSLSEDKGNKIAKRFGCYSSESELYSFWVDSLQEFYRLLRPNGTLIVKIQDKVSSGKQYWSHVSLINEAQKMGYTLVDLFILLSKNRITPAWQVKGQKHARKFHCYYLVFKK